MLYHKELFVRPKPPAGILDDSPWKTDTFHSARRCAALLGLCYQMQHWIRHVLNHHRSKSWFIWRMSVVQERIQALQTDLGIASHMEGKAVIWHGSLRTDKSTVLRAAVWYGSWISSWVWQLWNIKEKITYIF